MPWPPWNSGEPVSLEGELIALEARGEDRVPPLVELLPTASERGEVNVEDDEDDQHA